MTKKEPHTSFLHTNEEIEKWFHNILCNAVFMTKIIIKINSKI